MHRGRIVAKDSIDAILAHGETLEDVFIKHVTKTCCTASGVDKSPLHLLGMITLPIQFMGITKNVQFQIHRNPSQPWPVLGYNFTLAYELQTVNKDGRPVPHLSAQGNRRRFAQGINSGIVLCEEFGGPIPTVVVIPPPRPSPSSSQTTGRDTETSSSLSESVIPEKDRNFRFKPS